MTGLHPLTHAFQARFALANLCQAVRGRTTAEPLPSWLRQDLQSHLDELRDRIDAADALITATANPLIASGCTKGAHR